MIHAEKCKNDGKLLSGENLYLWLTVSENDKDLYQNGYLVGKLLRKEVGGVQLHYVNDLCSYRDSSQSGVNNSTSELCNLYAFSGDILGLAVKKSIRTPRVELKGFAYSKEIPFRSKVEHATCLEPIYDGVPRRCTAIASATSSACSKAGFKMLPCGDCQHICNANFKGVDKLKK